MQGAGSSATAVAGIATFSGLTLLKTSVIRIRASNGSFNTPCTTIAVGPGAASQLVFTTAPSATATAGAALATQPVIEIHDASGNRVTSATDTMDFTAYSDSGCSSPVAGGAQVAGSSATAVAGIASFSGLTFLKTSVIRIRASNGSLDTACTTIAVSSGALTQLVFTTSPSATNASPWSARTSRSRSSRYPRMRRSSGPTPSIGLRTPWRT